MSKGWQVIHANAGGMGVSVCGVLLPRVIDSPWKSKGGPFQYSWGNSVSYGPPSAIVDVTCKRCRRVILGGGDHAE